MTFSGQSESIRSGILNDMGLHNAPFDPNDIILFFMRSACAQAQSPFSFD